MVRKNCFDALICFKGDEADNICVRKYWIGRQRKPKNILTRRTWCEKDFLKRLLFLFFCDSIPPASPAMNSNNKKFFDGQKKFSVKKIY